MTRERSGSKDPSRATPHQKRNFVQPLAYNFYWILIRRAHVFVVKGQESDGGRVTTVERV
jgi:hypothetical protein